MAGSCMSPSRPRYLGFLLFVAFVLFVANSIFLGLGQSPLPQNRRGFSGVILQVIRLSGEKRLATKNTKGTRESTLRRSIRSANFLVASQPEAGLDSP